MNCKMTYIIIDRFNFVILEALVFKAYMMCVCFSPDVVSCSSSFVKKVFRGKSTFFRFSKEADIGTLVFHRLKCYLALCAWKEKKYRRSILPEVSEIMDLIISVVSKTVSGSSLYPLVAMGAILPNQK